MKVLLIGSGGREHALAYGISKSSMLEKLWVSPGNPGTAFIAENISLITNNEILKFCQTNAIDLVIIGPEKPLVDGLSDILRENNIIVFGPSKAAADIEAHKSFAKQLMQKYNIPTAGFVEFTSAELDKALEYVNSAAYPLVIKADGLAAGKGVLVCFDKDEAGSGLQEILKNKVFGKAGEKVIIEEFLEGEEASVFAITDGKEFICLPSAQDHKRAHDNDTGKNTGGMGSYAPAPVVTKDIQERLNREIIIPVLSAMKAEGREFSGCLYCGLMIKDGAIKVVEFNCRFGDPETQAVIPLLEGDLLKLLYSSAAGNLDKDAVKHSGKSAVCVVAASHGYPDFYDTGFEVFGLQDINDSDVFIFHAGTKIEFERIVTSGGRVLGLTAVTAGNDILGAKQKAYENLRRIHYENIYYRTDISDKALKKA